MTDELSSERNMRQCVQVMEQDTPPGLWDLGVWTLYASVDGKQL